MIETEIPLVTADGTMSTFTTRPDGGGPFPVVICYMDAPGIRERLRDMARRIATTGYYVLLPKLYYRTSPDFMLDFATGSNRDEMFSLMYRLSNAMIVRDTEALIAHVESEPAADARRIGCVGYCMSGPFSLSVAAAIVWLWVYHPEVGFLNLLLSKVGIEGPRWLLNRYTAMPSLILMGWWKGIGFAMLIFLAGLQGIPAELYEAATMDGANSRQRFFSITIPMLSPALFFVMVTSIIGAFQGFDVFYLMTRGGPANVTTTMVLHIYNNGFLYLKMGFASAMAMVLFGTIMLFTVLQWGFAKNWVHGFAD